LAAGSAVVMLALSLVLWAVPAALAAGFSGSVSTVPIDSNGDNAAGLALADLNGDGFPDLAASDPDGTAALFANDGAANFSPLACTPSDCNDGILGGAGNNPDGIAVGDLNGDGLPDVVVASAESPGSVALYLAHADRSYTESILPDAEVGAFPETVAIGDLNHDGKPDIAVGGGGPDAGLSVLLRSTPLGPTADASDYTATAPLAGTGMTTGVSLAVGDLNGDGLADIAIPTSVTDAHGDLTRALTVLYQDSASSTGFTTVSVPLPGATLVGGASAVAIGDLNGDGRPDLALASVNDDKVVPLLKDVADSGFTPGTALTPETSDLPTPQANLGGLAIADLNGDGRNDIAVGNPQDFVTTVFLKDASGDGYSATTVQADGGGPGSLVIGDLAGAGKLDIVTASSFDGFASVVANTTPQATTTSIAAPASSAFGQPVTFTASVAPTVRGMRGAPVPSGTLTYTVDGRTLSATTLSDAGTVLPSATAPLTTSELAVGSHTMTATYSLDAASAANYTASTATIDFTVTAATTITGTHSGPLTVTGPTSIVGAHVTGTVTVAPGASLDIEDSTIDGDVSAPDSAGLRVCGSTLAAGLSITDSAGLVVVGDLAGAACAQDTIDGDLTVTGNANGVEVLDDLVGGTITASGNSGPGPFPGGVSMVAGNGVIPVVSASPGAGAFPGTAVGAASATQTFTITNAGHAALNVSAIDLTGADAGQFALANDSCVAASPIAAGAHCSVDVTFRPTGLGARSAALSIASDDPSSPNDVPLTGTGLTDPTAAVSAGGATFPDTPPGAASTKTFTVTNDGQAALNIASVALSGTDAGQFAIGANTCTGTVAGGGSCSVEVDFAPSAVGSFTANLVITSNAPAAQVSLNGTGVPPPHVSLSGGSGVFAATTVGAAGPSQTVTVTNTGQATLQIASASLTGASAAQFTLANDTCSGAAVPAGGTCGVDVSFTPTVAGAAAASLRFASNAPSTPDDLGLSGTALSPQAVSLSQTSAVFADTTVGSAATAQAVRLTNSGGAALRVVSVALAGSDAGQYTLTADTCSGQEVAGGAGCGFSVNFTPTTPGSHGGAQIKVTSDAASSPDLILLSGSGVAPAPLQMVPQATPLVPQSSPQPAPPKQTVAPSNVVRFSTLKAGAKGRLTLTLKFPGAGRYTVRTTVRLPAVKAKHGKKKTKARTIVFGAPRSAAASRAASATIRISPNRAAAAALTAHHKLRVTVSVKFTPTTGTSRTTTSAVDAIST
jgi:hypothetical protein